MSSFARCAKIFALLALLLVPGAAPGTGAHAPHPGALAPASRGELGRQMERLLVRSATFGFSGQVVVAKNGEILLHGAYGFADRASGRRMETRTRIGIASLSKQFTAAAVLALREDGHLELEDPVSRFLPEVGPGLGSLTLHQLLTHTAGLPGGDPTGDDFELAGREDALRALATVEPVTAPGERWRYANVGYNLLAAIVEAVAEASFEDYVIERLLIPAGLDETGFWHRPGADADRIAHAYRAWMDQGSPASWPRNWRTWGSGDMLSTAADLYRWELALRRGAVLSAESVELLRTPHAPIGETGDAYGYGWFLHPPETGDGHVIEHGGDWLGGYNAFHYVDPSEDLVLTLTSNSTDASGMWLRQAVQKALIDLATGKEAPSPPPAAEPIRDPEPLCGAYVLPGGDRFHLFRDGAHLWIAAEGQNAAEGLLALDVDAADDLARAVSKTSRLFAGLLRGSKEAYAEALEDAASEHLESYWGEWTALEERNGKLRAYRVLGARPFHRSAGTAVLLRFPEAEITMNTLWADGGAGRLHGTLVHRRPATPMPFPAAYPIARTGEKRLIAYDIFRRHGAQITVERDGGTTRLVLRPLGGGGGGDELTARRVDDLLPTASGWKPHPEPLPDPTVETGERPE